ncbi:MAG: helix-hairpin-helix domain-containing protein [bacterium]
MSTVPAINLRVAERLREAAELLSAQGANPFRVAAYRRAATTLEALERDVKELVDAEGIDGLMALPAVGESLAAAIREIAITGRYGQLERLRGTIDPETLFATVPGIGRALARRIHDALHVDTLEALETAAHDGRLDAVPGLGARRLAAIRASLDAMLGRVRSRPRPPAGSAVAEPSARDILDVDREYRAGAEADRLPKIAPKRMNPEAKAWLPILHTDRGPWHFTALFSNTARAHELGRTRDWVVIYFYDGEHREGQRTVVSETRGILTGKRVIRGREAECKEIHLAESKGTTP